MPNTGILAATSKFCTTKQFVVGTGGTSIIFSIIIMGFVNPMISANGEDIDNNSEDIKAMIASVSANTEALSNIDNTLQKLDITIAKLDDKIGKLDDRLDTMTLVMCDISNGKHCN